MKKIPYSELLKSMTMFFVDEAVDEKYMALRSSSLEGLATRMQQINHRAGLKKFIADYPDSIDKLLVVLGVSGEYFKRIISMFRILKGQEFQTEWTLSTTRRFMLEDNDLMNRVLTLFLEADENNELVKYIPKYRLSSFKITPAVMGRLANSDFLTFLFSKDNDTPFNNEMTKVFSDQLGSMLSEICQLKGFILQRGINVNPNGNNTRNIHSNYAIFKPGEKQPSYYIKYSFQLTTSKGQTSTKNEVKNLRDFIINFNPQAKQIMVLDGAGWVGRQSDLKDIWDYSNFCLNLSHLEQLKEIIH